MNDPALILVVDDNETNRDILVTRLEAHGYNTLQAADGEEALAAVAQSSSRSRPSRRDDAET